MAKARLRALGATASPTKPASTTSTAETMTDIARHRARGGVAHKDAAYAFNPNPEHLAMLLDMGMSRERGYRALQAVNNSSVEAALDWLGEHQDDTGQQLAEA